MLISVGVVRRGKKLGFFRKADEMHSIQVQSTIPTELGSNMIWASQHCLIASQDHRKATWHPKPSFQMSVAFFLPPSVSLKEAGFYPQLSVWIKSYTDLCSLSGGKQYQIISENKNISASIWSQQAKPGKKQTCTWEWKLLEAQCLWVAGYRRLAGMSLERKIKVALRIETLHSWNLKLCMFWGGGY